MRRKAALLAVALVDASCGVEAAETTTTATAVEQTSATASSTTTTVAEATTVTGAGPVNVGEFAAGLGTGTFRKLAAGTTYAEFGDRAIVFGVGACQIAREWVGELGGYVSVIGGSADPDRHGQAVAKVGELFEGMSFDVGAGP